MITALGSQETYIVTSYRSQSQTAEVASFNTNTGFMLGLSEMSRTSTRP